MFLRNEDNGSDGRRLNLVDLSGHCAKKLERASHILGMLGPLCNCSRKEQNERSKQV